MNRLCLISNRKIIKSGTLCDVIKKAVNGGVDTVILREKDLNNSELFKIACEIQEIIKEKNTLLIINGNLQVAKDIKADGYHTGFNNFIEEKPKFNGIIGVSVHSLKEAILAEKNGANYLLASHVFETDCKKGLKPRGIKFIKDIKKNVNIPVIALGGIKPNNAGEVLLTGVKGIAIMSGIMSSYDPYSSAKEFKNIIKKLI